MTINVGLPKKVIGLLVLISSKCIRATAFRTLAMQMCHGNFDMSPRELSEAGESSVTGCGEGGVA